MNKKILMIFTLCVLGIGLVGCRKQILKNEDVLEPSDKVSISIKENTLTNNGATIIIKNNSDDIYVYGPEYIIQTKKDGNWIEVETITGDPLAWNSIAYILKANEEKELNIDWSLGYGELTSGQYRLVKKVFKEEDRPIDDSEIKYISVDFKIS